MIGWKRGKAAGGRIRLLHYTYRKLLALSLLLMALWGVLFYYAIMEEVVDETNDTLRNQAHLLIKRALRDPSMLDAEENPLAIRRRKGFAIAKPYMTLLSTWRLRTRMNRCVS